MSVALLVRKTFFFVQEHRLATQTPVTNSCLCVNNLAIMD